MLIMEGVAVKIKQLNAEIKSSIRKRDELNHHIQKLTAEKETLQSQYNLKLSLEGSENWSADTFPWSKQIHSVLQSTFCLKNFRLQQLAAINATLSKKDLLLLMPTGGGKTLCYQLPAIVNNGMTLVVSPLLALMEDQLIALRKLGIRAMSMSSGTEKEIKNAGFHYMTKGVGEPIKLMYVTPEWLSKSKRFMSALQKLHEAKKLDRIAIDEVHCCSQWGHDFRPDYKYLGLLKGMFGDVPIIGLTATATTAVLMDIQKMLDIPGCAIIRAPFDRPNLCFKVVPKNDKADDNYLYLEDLLTKRFRNVSGIIYTATIKDCVELTQALKARGLSVKHYHAELPDDQRTKTHKKWLENEFDVVIATVAFGMGIDKADVRFVIHYSMPKSMETLYQECGRAGRDGEKAECIVMFRLTDYFKTSGYTKSRTDVTNATSVLKYCLNLKHCRHYLIGLHFEETAIRRCQSACDNCKKRRTLTTYDAKPAVDDIYKVIESALASETNVTLNKLVELWLRPKIKIRKPNISKECAENIIGNLVTAGCLREEKNYTPYSVNVYLRKGSVFGESVEIVLGEDISYLKKLNGGKRQASSDSDCEIVTDEDSGSTSKKSKT